MKTEEHKEQIANAIKWIDEMYGRPKTIGVLERNGEYCCLGSGCLSMSINTKDHTNTDPYIQFRDKVGLIGIMGDLANNEGRYKSLVGLNDSKWAEAKVLDVVADYIKANPDNVFESQEVIEGVRDHYAKT